MTQSHAPRILIIGGVAGGASAATRARRMNERASIVMLEKDGYVSFANCGLPYHIGGAIQDRAKLLVAKPEMFRQRFNIDVRVRHEALAIDRQAKVVRIRDHAQGVVYDEPYDKLILAPGAAPLMPDLPGVRAPGVHSLRNLEDMDRILGDLPGVRRAAVVGGGFIGLEVAEQLRERGMEVALVERNDQVLPPLDPEMAERLRRELLAHGVQVRLGSGLAGVETRADGRASGVRLDNGAVIPADLVILGLGVRPSNRLAVEAGLDIGATGGVRTDDRQRTSDPDIYAVGDVAEYAHGPTGGRARIPLAGIANRTGRLAGEHAATGQSAPAPAAWGTAILKVFGLAAGLTGDSVKSAKARGLDARAVHVTANHHAGYYPGAKPLTLKLVYEAGTGRVLGAQAFGGAGVDKRLDIVASLLHFRGTAADLAQVDLAYAPPFGAAKDAVHMAAFAALNDLEGKAPIAPADIDLAAYQVVDVREPDECAELPLAGAPHAIRIPLNALRARAGELDRARPTVVSCHSGLRSHVATRLLRELGFDARNLSGAASLRDLALNRPESASAPAAACSAAKPCGAPGSTLARDPHDELHPRNVLEESRGGALLLDVRSAGEYRSVHVEGAVNLPLERVNPDSVRAILGGRDATVVLLCASGGRARAAAKRLIPAGLRAIVVTGGTKACVSQGLPVRRATGGSIELERQVRIGAGLLVAAGVALGTWVHPGFYGLSGFVGCGLVFAGVTDFCGMGLLLARMPWNR
jgi:NADPH-dependent 2,4-dienoyl-CoA reductase/sulfur reductase-like enzyme/rhodanese-related sulfurtransferase